MSGLRRIAIVIPARDEEQLVVRCLTAVTMAAAELSTRPDAPQVDILLVADGCVDQTASAARRVPGIRVIELSGVGVGAARRAGADLALTAGADWLANTDADSVVPVGWLTRQRMLADAGADAVVGTVRPDFAELSVAQRIEWLDAHADGKALGHVHGANLGVRADAYRRSGGFLPLAEHEDNDLVTRLARTSRVIADSELEVMTSARRVGRTPGGYAGYLRRTLGDILPATSL